MKPCPKCSREFIDQFNFCPMDGEKLSDIKNEEDKTEDSRKEIDKEEYDF